MISGLKLFERGLRKMPDGKFKEFVAGIFGITLKKKKHKRKKK